MRDSFVFYRSFAEVISMIPDAEDKITLLNALIEYGLNGTEPDLQYPLSAMFKQMTSSIAGAQRRYQANVENGKKGGNPNFKKGKSNPYYSSKKITQDNPKITQHNPDITQDNREITPDNLNDNDNVNDNEKIYKDFSQLSLRKNLNNPSDETDGTLLEAVPPPPGWEWRGGVLEDDGHHFRLAINKTTREGRGIQLD
jgi:hypothetical protein